MKKLTPLLIQEVAGNGGFTHMVTFTADDLTETTANTAQAITLPTIPIGFVILKGLARLIVPFKDASDAAYNSTTFTLGDAGVADRYIASSQLNENGTEITYPTFNNTAYQETAATALLATFGSMAAKSLVNIDKGELHLFLQILDTRALSEARGQTGVTK